MQELKNKVNQISRCLNKKQQTLCLAESCTGGLLSSLITNEQGSSQFFLGSIVSYSNQVKISQLKVSADLLSTKGAFNEDVALLMAKGVKSLLKADWSLSITGMLECDSATKPFGVKEGSIFVSVCSLHSQDISKTVVSGLNREEKKLEAALFSLDFLIAKLLQ